MAMTSLEKFTSNVDSSCWRNVLLLYNQVIKIKADKMKSGKGKELIDLDKWYQNELPVALESRKDKHVKQEELNKLMKWKLTRGKFRPRLQQLVESNPAELVETCSTKAFKAMPNISAAVQALTELKAVGPATASAVLAAGCPESVPFMADESMLALPGLQPLQYTLPALLNYIKQVKGIVQSLKKQDPDFGWTAHKVELCLWTFHLGKTLCLDDLKKVLMSSNEKHERESADNDEPRKKRVRHNDSP